MRSFTISHSIPSRAARLLAALFLCVLVSPASAAVSGPGTNEDFSAVGKSVVKLLQSRDTARFAAEMSPAIEDWQSILSTNAAGQNPDPLAGFRQSAEHDRQKIEQGAKQLLAQADSLHLDFSKGSLRTQVIPPGHSGNTRYPALMAENETLP